MPLTLFFLQFCNIIFAVKLRSRTYFWSVRLFGLFGLLVLLGAQQKAVAFAEPRLPEPAKQHAPKSESDLPHREPVSLQQTLPDGFVVRTAAAVAPSIGSSRELPIFPQIGNAPRDSELPASIPELLISIFLKRAPLVAHLRICEMEFAALGDRLAFKTCLRRTGPPPIS